MKLPMNWCRFGLKTILLALLVIAVFFADDRMGCKVAWDADNWNEAGGSGSISAHPLTIDGCVVPTDSSSDEASDPFALDHPFWRRQR